MRECRFSGNKSEMGISERSEIARNHYTERLGLFSFLCGGSPDTTFVMKISRCLVPSVAFLLEHRGD